VHGDRWRPPGIGPDAEDRAIGDDLDVAIQIGPKDRDPRAHRERREGLWRGVPVLVADPRGDDRHRRPDGVDEPRGGRRVRPVVPDLQHVDRVEQAARGEQGLDRRFGVAGQQRGKAAELEL